MVIKYFEKLKQIIKPSSKQRRLAEQNDNYQYNSLKGYLLFSKGKFGTARETILAGCYYCQKTKDIINCSNTVCPLYDFMRKKRYRVDGLKIYPQK